MEMKRSTDLSKKEGTNETGIRGNFYATAGEKCKVIGLQDGTFPDFGHHLRDEMGGIWMHPIKAADAFWMKVDQKFLIADEYETLPYGNRFFYRMEQGIQAVRTQISPDAVGGVMITCEFTNTSEKTQEIACEFITRFDILPVWFSDRNGIMDFEDEAVFDTEHACIVAKDGGHDWYAVLGCDFELAKEQVSITKEHIGLRKTVGKGISAAIARTVTLEAGAVCGFTYYITASEEGREKALSDFRRMKEEKETLIEEKRKRCEVIEETTKLITNDASFDEVFRWAKYNADWLILDCGKYGRGIAAGMPEYPWWFGCDSAYTVQGLLAMGEFELARQTLVLLRDYSERYNGNGRILHEINTFGHNAHSGNSQETCHYITAVYHYLRWTGDLKTAENLYPYCEKGIDWLFLEMDSDKDLLPSGYGIIEIEGLNVELIDTAVYSCQALYMMDEMAHLLGADPKDYCKKAEKLKKIINTRLWDDSEKLYVDAVGTPKQILERMEVLLTQPRYTEIMEPSYRNYLLNLKDRLLQMPQEEEIPFIINKNWVINIPMETQLAEKEKAYQALKTMRSEDFVSEYGLRLSGFMKAGTMTISTGVQAVAEGRYYNCNESLSLLKRMFKTFGMTLPGSMNEMSPDYGCFTQAWTIYGVMVPVVECFAGIRPFMQQQKVVVEPCVPDAWDKMQLTGIRIGEGNIDFSYRKEQKKVVYEIIVKNIGEAEFVLRKKGNIRFNGTEAGNRFFLAPGRNVIEVTDKTYEAVIFDLDGVICHTDGYHYQAWKMLADRLGIYFDEKINHRLRGVSRMESLAIILERSSKDYTGAEKLAFAEEKNNVYRELLNNMKPSDLSAEVKDTLDALRAAGIKLAIGSSSKNAGVILNRLGIDDYFDAVSDGNNITKSKPDPEVFVKASEYLGVPAEQCLVVEDAAAGVKAALAGGMDCAAIGDAADYRIADYDLHTFSDLKKICI